MKEFNGRKSILIANTNPLIGRQYNFLSILYLTIGTIGILSTLVMIWIDRNLSIKIDEVIEIDEMTPYFFRKISTFRSMLSWLSLLPICLHLLSLRTINAFNISIGIGRKKTKCLENKNLGWNKFLFRCWKREKKQKSFRFHFICSNNSMFILFISKREYWKNLIALFK